MEAYPPINEERALKMQLKWLSNWTSYTIPWKLRRSIFFSWLFFSPVHLIMDKKSIIQWNCRGLKANFNEILILMSLFFS